MRVGVSPGIHPNTKRHVSSLRYRNGQNEAGPILMMRGSNRLSLNFLREMQHYVAAARSVGLSNLLEDESAVPAECNRTDILLHLLAGCDLLS
jgi:hypothetical protein